MSSTYFLLLAAFAISVNAIFDHGPKYGHDGHGHDFKFLKGYEPKYESYGKYEKDSHYEPKYEHDFHEYHKIPDFHHGDSHYEPKHDFGKDYYSSHTPYYGSYEPKHEDYHYYDKH